MPTSPCLSSIVGCTCSPNGRCALSGSVCRNHETLLTSRSWTAVLSRSSRLGVTRANRNSVFGSFAKRSAVYLCEVARNETAAGPSWAGGAISLRNALESVRQETSPPTVSKHFCVMTGVPWRGGNLTDGQKSFDRLEECHKRGGAIATVGPVPLASSSISLTSLSRSPPGNLGGSPWPLGSSGRAALLAGSVGSSGQCLEPSVARDPLRGQEEEREEADGASSAHGQPLPQEDANDLHRSALRAALRVPSTLAP